MQEAKKVGKFKAIWTWFLGQEDPIERELRALNNEGKRGARLSHVVSVSFMVLLSITSLLTLGGDALNKVLAEYRRGNTNWIELLALSVVPLFVLGMDIGAGRGAVNTRTARMRRAPLREYIHHVIVMVLVMVGEGVTYGVFSFIYDPPSSGMAVGLIIFRAALAPPLIIYLALDAPRAPVPRDMVNLIEFHSGLLFIQRLLRLSALYPDDAAYLGAIYRAATTPGASDAARLQLIVNEIDAYEEKKRAANMAVLDEVGAVVLGSTSRRALPSGRRHDGARSASAQDEADPQEYGDEGDENGARSTMKTRANGAPAIRLVDGTRSKRASKGRTARVQVALGLLEADEERRAFAFLDSEKTEGREPSVKKLADTVNVSEDRARTLRGKWYRARAPRVGSTREDEAINE